MWVFKALAVAIAATWGGGALFFFGIVPLVVDDTSQLPLAYVLFCTIMTAVHAKYIYDVYRGRVRLERPPPP